MLRLPTVSAATLALSSALTSALTLAGVLVQVPTTRAAAEEPDVTAPQIDTSPAWCADPCQREVFEFWGDLAEGDDLASIEVLLDGAVVDTRIYDDGTGFVPYGWYQPLWADYLQQVDYAVQVPVPTGDHDVRVILRDPAGNTREDVHAIRGAEPPDAVRRLRAVAHGRAVWIRFVAPRDNGGVVTQYRVVRDRRAARTVGTGPGLPMPTVSYDGLAPGRHRFVVRAINSAGVGERAVVRVRVHRR